MYWEIDIYGHAGSRKAELLANITRLGSV